MPIYLCLPGHASKEPWRHGMRIFDRPHDVKDNTSDRGEKKGRHNQPISLRSVSDSSNEAAVVETATIAVESHNNNENTTAEEEAFSSIRKARHAEVLLADSLIQSHGRNWLRLRWPGPHGGFGGFVALDEAQQKRMSGDGNKSKLYPTCKSMKLLDEYDDGLGEGEEGEGGEVSFCGMYY
jgi:hypothetical protein